MNGKDVGMIERGHGARFLLEAAQAIGFGGERAGKNFQRDVASEARVFGAIDFAHPARADGSDDFIGTEFRAGNQRHACAQLYMPRQCLGCNGKHPWKSTLAALVESHPFGSAQGRLFAKCAKDGAAIVLPMPTRSEA